MKQRFIRGLRGSAGRRKRRGVKCIDGRVERAAREGYAPVQYNFPLALRNGNGVAADPERAFAFMQLAASACIPRAQFGVAARRAMILGRSMSRTDSRRSIAPPKGGASCAPTGTR
jgi:hypothetical protein